MEILPMVSMALSDEDKSDMACVPTAANQPNYPWGLSITLCNKELDKLGISYDDIETDDIVHMHCLAVITSKSSNTVQGTEPAQRIELQITHICAEDEDEENEEEESKMTASKKISKLYK